MTNNLKTFVLLAALTALMLAVGQALGGRQGMVLGLIFALAVNLGAYWFSDRIALAMSGAQEVSEAEAPELYAILRRLSQRAGLPMPRVYVTPEAAPNAFATGRDPAHAAVAVTRGILPLLGREELEGVLAHELAHVRNRDVLISSIAAVLAGVLTQVAHLAQWGLMWGGRDEEEGGGGIVGELLMILVAPIAAALVQMAISRAREFEADRTGAQICGHPLALASALEKLERGLLADPMVQASPATAHMYIANPFAGVDGVLQLFATHPPMRERIERLHRMAMGLDAH